MLKKHLAVICLFVALIFSINEVSAVISPTSCPIRISPSSSTPFNTTNATAITSLTINTGPVPIYQNSTWIEEYCPGFTLTVSSTVGNLVDVFLKPGADPAQVTTETDSWVATQAQYTISSATASTATAITTTTTPTGVSTGSVVMVTQGAGTGTMYTDATFGLNGRLYTVASVSGSVITLTGANTANLSVSGASGGFVTVIPTTRNVAIVYQDGVPVQSANHAARLIGTYLTGAAGVSGQTEDSSFRKLVWNADTLSQTNLNSLLYNGVGTTSANITSTIPTMCNSLCLYTVSGSPLADTVTGPSANLYIGGRRSNVQTFYDGVSNFYNELVPETPVTMSTNTATTVYDVYAKGGGNGTNNLTYSQIAWASATTQPTHSKDPANRLTKNGDTTSLLIGAYYALSATTTNDTSSERLVSSVYEPIPKQMSAGDATTSWSTTSTTAVTANGSTVDGVGRFTYLQAVANYPVILANIQGSSNSSTYPNYAGIGINTTTTATVFGSQQSAVANTIGDSILNYINPAVAGITFVQRVNYVQNGTGTFYGINNATLGTSRLTGIIWN